jgi:hypothetical protein
MGKQMKSIAEMYADLNKMEFCLEVDGFQTDSDPIEAALEYLLQGKTVTISIWKDHRGKL